MSQTEAMKAAAAGGRTAAAVVVVPRWEWRAFERTFARPSEPELGAATDSIVEREETYLLSMLSPHNVKIRDDQLDIKRLDRTDASGLELWRPVLKRPFPIEADALAAACDAWGVVGPAGAVPAHSRTEFLRTVAGPHPQLRIVVLTKRRLAVTVAGCRGERAQIRIGDHRWNTVAFEDADPARVRAALRELNLDPAANENYPRALKRILGLRDHPSVPSQETPC